METLQGSICSLGTLVRLCSLGLLLLAGCSPQLIGSSNRGLGIAGLSISVTYGANPGGYYSDSVTETGPRTITFSHNGTSVLCSHDGGTTYAACDSANTLIFTVADYTGSKVLKIKASKSGYADAVYTITLPTDLPGITFSTCSVTLGSSDFPTFIAAAAFANNRVVCVSASAAITNIGANEANISPGAFTNVQIIGLGTGATRPTFTRNTGAGNDAVFHSTASGFVISNVIIVKTANGTTQPAIMNDGNGSMKVSGVSCTSSSVNAGATVWGQCLGIANFGTMTTNVSYSDFTSASIRPKMSFPSPVPREVSITLTT